MASRKAVDLPGALVRRKAKATALKVKLDENHPMVVATAARCSDQRFYIEDDIKSLHEQVTCTKEATAQLAIWAAYYSQWTRSFAETQGGCHLAY